MIYLILSILCSVIVGVLLKFAKRYHINIAQTITWNYLFAIAHCAFFFSPNPSDLSFKFIEPIHLILGILLPTIFIFLGLSVQKTGLARTDIAQRLSLLISLTATYFIFNEQYNGLKYIGIAIGFLAIFFTLYRSKQTQIELGSWVYPLLVFLGFGVIDVCFKILSQDLKIPYTTSLLLIFGIAFCLSLSFILFKKWKSGVKIEFINFVCGGILGLFNFGNILFYMKAHRSLAENPSTVFAAMNIGVILLGSIIGVLIFKEKLNKLNYLGLALSLIAIVLITLSQIYV